MSGLHGPKAPQDSPGWALLSDVDFVTALCSQVVYEGLVDDTFRIKCGEWSPYVRNLGKCLLCPTLLANPSCRERGLRPRHHGFRQEPEGAAQC